MRANAADSNCVQDTSGAAMDSVLDEHPAKLAVQRTLSSFGNMASAAPQLSRAALQNRRVLLYVDILK